MTIERTMVASVIALGLLSALAAPALAQKEQREQRDQREGSSYLAYAGSDVSLISRSSDDQNGRVNTPVVAGDRLQTGASSRAEVILADGSVLRVDARTGVRFDRLARTSESDDDRDLIFLEKGAISLETHGNEARETAPRVDTDDATIVLPDRSVVRIDAGKRGTEIYVLTGRAEVATRAGRAVVRAGDYAYAAGDEPIEVDSGAFPRDRFTRFVEERRDRAGRRGTRYVSEDYAYDYDKADLDEYGSWTYLSTYENYGWRPRVAAGWAPYGSGQWRWSPAGLAWVSSEPWGWLPYHYGSWVYDDELGWVWIPGNTYSPAWVYWSYSPSWVGWCPIGYYGYYGGYYRWCRDWYPHRRFDHAYPHLSGVVEMTRIDRRGWSFTHPERLGARLDSGDVVRGERVLFGKGQTGLISTAPLRVDRGDRGSVPSAIVEAVRTLSAQGQHPGDGKGKMLPMPSEGLAQI